ncbi:phage prohead protease [Bifidobacterium saguini DSM 23967]|uniref:Phage prohead protease n=2 Tax=Bifidobacterium saguini TaxID=762210 RepID=A0A087D600_9BIFI|nr:phage major capsid protein [Bifidobacterium saguini]KFI90950.1 phage prohead protease [Bifidobacterium saguini DSM 23967]QTB91442.1 phage major capsid protein [Bifidobacterium saguini]
MNRHEIGFKGVCLRAAEEGDGRTLEGIAVPFGSIIDTWEGAETFDPDCRFDDADNAKLCYQHGELIGRITGTESREDGLHITARISDTQRGRDVATLLRDGALDSLSVGFIPVENEVDKQGITHRKRVRLLETSVVSWPAYEAAKITGQRSAEPLENMSETGKPSSQESEETRMDKELAEMLDGIKDEQRSLKAALAHAGSTDNPKPLGSEYRTAGDYLQALYRGEDTAVQLMHECRDLIATGDTGNTTTWIADDLRLIQMRRKVTNLLTHDTLPAKGMTMEYNVVATDTTTTGKQTNEGGALPFGKVTFGTKSVGIDTYGGYTTLSRQTIERSTTPMLNTALSALRNAYAKATENAVRTYLYNTIATQRDAATGANKIDAPAALAAMTIDQWAGLIMDAAELADDRNVSLTRLGVSKDVMAALIKLKDTGTRFFDLSGDGSDTIGSFDLTGIAGRFLRVPVQMLPKAPAGTACFIDPEAVTVWESGGPTQLSDGDPTKLTENYSVYGYLAVAATQPLGLIPVKFSPKA